MRQTSNDGLLWFDERSIGITDTGLARYGACLVFVPKVNIGDKVKKGQVLASMEGQRALAPFKSPFAGTVVNVAQELVNTPYEINSRLVLFEVQPS